MYGSLNLTVGEVLCGVRYLIARFLETLLGDRVRSDYVALPVRRPFPVITMLAMGRNVRRY